jgi:23S rRNA (adenine1618-N6)-methyltransferase
VPVRWNYVHWIQELLDTTGESYSDRYDPERPVTGLDIGVGASCIYGLLACATRPNWRMIGTDIDEHSLECARQNVKSNGLGERIKLCHSNTDDPLIPLDTLARVETLQVEELDFVMTNPPFYASKEDMEASYTNKATPPSAVCTGSENEMICEGGEVGLVARIIEESLKLGERVQWYTAMLGRLPSLRKIVEKLKGHGITNFAVCSLQAGFKTNRWAIAWSLRDYRPKNSVARHGQLVHPVLPSPTAQTIAAPLHRAQLAGEKIDAALKELDVRWQWRTNVCTGVMEAKENVWSRAGRRKKKFADAGGETASEDAQMRETQKDTEEEDDEDSEEDDEPVVLAVKIVCKAELVEVRWLRGSDYKIFTSFCGMLKNNVLAAKTVKG